MPRQKVCCINIAKASKRIQPCISHAYITGYTCNRSDCLAITRVRNWILYHHIVSSIKAFLSPLDVADQNQGGIVSAQVASYYYNITPVIASTSFMHFAIADLDSRSEATTASLDTSFAWYYRNNTLRVLCKANLQSASWIGFGV